MAQDGAAVGAGAGVLDAAAQAGAGDGAGWAELGHGCNCSVGVLGELELRGGKLGVITGNCSSMNECS